MTQTQDTVEDEKAPDPGASMVQQDLLSRLGELLDVIDEREATILRLRYGLENNADPMTLKEIGKIVGLTRERVRQIERDALKKLYDVTEGVATITLTRPEADNAISPEMIAGLSGAYRRCDEDDDRRIAAGNQCVDDRRTQKGPHQCPPIVGNVVKQPPGLTEER